MHRTRTRTHVHFMHLLTTSQRQILHFLTLQQLPGSFAFAAVVNVNVCDKGLKVPLCIKGILLLLTLNELCGAELLGLARRKKQKRIVTILCSERLKR